ncbi:hypothetical protein H4219_003965 [Mycoemilia scoparia]|uniref:ubiquitinyl hydrolase 1 n=1 Tax=Mycoemilia scoparia TaxID=417184 RepID=A0A9W8DNI9_9FUNG|nr:hypothetical protein H4219_003965 [Mycoemilia scoparia]
MSESPPKNIPNTTTTNATLSVPSIDIGRGAGGGSSRPSSTSDLSWCHTPMDDDYSSQDSPIYPGLPTASQSGDGASMRSLHAMTVSQAKELIDSTKTPKDGDKVFLIDRAWFNHFSEWAQGEDKRPPGSMQTMYFIDETTGQLRPGTTKDDVFGVMPETWQVLVSHFGYPGIPSLQRYVVAVPPPPPSTSGPDANTNLSMTPPPELSSSPSANDNTEASTEIELYPPIIHLVQIKCVGRDTRTTTIRHQPTTEMTESEIDMFSDNDISNTGGTAEGPLNLGSSSSLSLSAIACNHSPTLTVSEAMLLSDLKTLIRSVAHLSESTLIRLWKFEQPGVTTAGNTSDAGTIGPGDRRSSYSPPGDILSDYDAPPPSYEESQAGGSGSVQVTGTIIAPHEIPEGATVISAPEENKTFLRDVGLASGSIVAYEIKFSQHELWPSETADGDSDYDGNDNGGGGGHPGTGGGGSGGGNRQRRPGLSTQSTSSSMQSVNHYSGPSYGASPTTSEPPTHSSSYTHQNTTTANVTGSGDNNSSSIPPNLPPRALTPQTHQTIEKPGLCGLNNLGNTCYMNSALQCLSNTPALSLYFRSGIYNQEINQSNPLGKDGDIATAYGKLVNEMWSGTHKTFRPRGFKDVIGHHSRPNYPFGGYGQQDAPEFLAFLLDCLHEDLNRIIKKPYIEAKDSDGRPDQDVADEQWDVYKMRNDSVIVDLFQGQYRSKVECPDCHKTSTIFDPFMYLTLPLPIKRKVNIELLYVPSNPEMLPTEMHLNVNKSWTFLQLKELIAHLKQFSDGRGPQNLFVCEVYDSRICQVYCDKELISAISKGDKIVVYELPENLDTIGKDIDNSQFSLVQIQFTNHVPQTASSSSNSGGYYSSYMNHLKLFGDPLVLCLGPKDSITISHLYIQVAKWFQRCTPSGLLDGLIKQFEKVLCLDKKSVSENSTIESTTPENYNEWTLEDIWALTKIVMFKISKASQNTTQTQSRSTFGSGFSKFSRFSGYGMSSFSSKPTTPFTPMARSVNASHLTSLFSKSNLDQMDQDIQNNNDTGDDDDAETVDGQDNDNDDNNNSSSRMETEDIEPYSHPSDSSMAMDSPSFDATITDAATQPTPTPPPLSSKSLTNNTDDIDNQELGISRTNSSSLMYHTPENDIPGTSGQSQHQSMVNSKPTSSSVVTRNDNMDQEEDDEVEDDGDASSSDGQEHADTVSEMMETDESPFDLRAWLCQTIELKTNDIIVCECDSDAIIKFVSQKASSTIGSATSNGTSSTTKVNRINDGDGESGSDLDEITMTTTTTYKRIRDVDVLSVLRKDHADQYHLPDMDEIELDQLQPIPDKPVVQAFSTNDNDEVKFTKTVQQPQHSRTKAKKSITLQKCIEEFTKPEKLGDNDSWYCSSCKKHQQANKKFDIWRLPEYLVIHLKRFEQARTWSDKLDVVVDFPIEGLDLTKSAIGNTTTDSSDQQPLIYDLYAVCNHYGGMGGGHYTAYAKHSDTNTWYEYNDSRVEALDSPKQVISKAAYLLFYKLRTSNSSTTVANSLASCSDCYALSEDQGSRKINALIKEYLTKPKTTPSNKLSSPDKTLSHRPSKQFKPAASITSPGGTPGAIVFSNSSDYDDDDNDGGAGSSMDQDSPNQQQSILSPSNLPKQPHTLKAGEWNINRSNSTPTLGLLDENESGPSAVAANPKLRAYRSPSPSPSSITSSWRSQTSDVTLVQKSNSALRSSVGSENTVVATTPNTLELQQHAPRIPSLEEQPSLTTSISDASSPSPSSSISLQNSPTQSPADDCPEIVDPSESVATSPSVNNTSTSGGEPFLNRPTTQKVAHHPGFPRHIYSSRKVKHTYTSRHKSKCHGSNLSASSPQGQAKNARNIITANSSTSGGGGGVIQEKHPISLSSVVLKSPPQLSTASITEPSKIDITNAAGSASDYLNNNDNSGQLLMSSSRSASPESSPRKRASPTHISDYHHQQQLELLNSSFASGNGGGSSSITYNHSSGSTGNGTTAGLNGYTEVSFKRRNSSSVNPHHHHGSSSGTTNKNSTTSRNNPGSPSSTMMMDIDKP